MLVVALSYILKHVWEMPVCTILVKEDPEKDPMSTNATAAPDISVQCSVFPRNQAKTFIVASLTETGQHSSLLSSLSSWPGGYFQDLGTRDASAPAIWQKPQTYQAREVKVCLLWSVQPTCWADFQRWWRLPVWLLWRKYNELYFLFCLIYVLLNCEFHRAGFNLLKFLQTVISFTRLRLLFFECFLLRVGSKTGKHKTS